VIGADPITVPGVGAAHHVCYQTRLTAERIFNGLNIAKLDDIQFNELSDLVLMEKICGHLLPKNLKSRLRLNFFRIIPSCCAN